MAAGALAVAAGGAMSDGRTTKLMGAGETADATKVAKRVSAGHKPPSS